MISKKLFLRPKVHGDNTGGCNKKKSFALRRDLGVIQSWRGDTGRAQRFSGFNTGCNLPLPPWAQWIKGTLLL